MQPITLHLQGLQSFRQPTRIDLARLGEHGLFGVFGPIGSGKSTLLDAMTLALYGQIDRLAGRSKRGIINHQSKRCEVRLRFAIGDTHWEAQRAYRRDKQGNAVRVHSRLGRVEGGQLVVVADKEREVNERIEALLGLNAADFMRAVVLPQGRFMQFLQLHGTDRRRMLQRIFHLESFGEGLRARVKRETVRVDASLQRVLGELDGLGAATPEAVDAAKTEWEAATTLAAGLDARETTLTQQLEGARAAAAHHQRLSDATTRLEGHEQKAEDQARQQAALTLARVARPLLSLQAEINAAQEAHQQLRMEQEAAEAAHDVARKQQIDALDVRNRQLAADETQPETVVLRQELQAALTADQRLREVVVERARVERRRTTLDRKLTAGRRALSTLNRELEDIVTRRATLRKRFGDLAVTNELRERVQRAEHNRSRLESARERARVLGDALRATDADRTEAQAHLDRATEALHAGHSRRERLLQHAAGLQEQTTAIEPWREALLEVTSTGLIERLQRGEDDVATARERLDSARAANAEATVRVKTLGTDGVETPLLAGVLAARLDGPCSVCGSVEHPNPAPERPLSDLLDRVEARARAAAEQRASRRAELDATKAMEAREKHLSTLKSRVPHLLTDFQPEELSAMAGRLATAQRALERSLSRTDRAVRALQPALNDASNLVAAAKSQLANIDNRLERDRQELHRSKAIEGQAWGTMMDALGEFTLFDLPRLLREIQQSDQEREELEPRLREVDNELEHAQARWERTRTARDRRAIDLTAIDHELEKLSETHAQLVNVLAPYEGRDVQTALKELDAAVAKRNEERRLAQQAVETTTRAVVAATDARARHRARATSAAARLERARAALLDALARTGQTDVPPASAALDGADLDAMQQELLDWSAERAALRLTVETLSALEHPLVTRTMVETLRCELDDVRRSRREAADRRSRAEERHHYLSARSERHAKLETERASTSERASRLAELSRLLRGDRFVEYVANDFLADLVREASRHLGRLTRSRYALSLHEDGTFLVVDLDAGGATRPASSLSGGETFIASLALALALSTQVQRHNAAALEFFFLDEGFGSLDPESLDRVMTAIESLAAESRVIGLISHVGAVRERVPRRLELHCPRDGSGTVARYREA